MNPTPTDTVFIIFEKQKVILQLSLEAFFCIVTLCIQTKQYKTISTMKISKKWKYFEVPQPSKNEKNNLMTLGGLHT